MANYPLSYAISTTSKVRKSTTPNYPQYEYGINVFFSLSEEDLKISLHSLVEKFKVHKTAITSIVKKHWGGQFDVEEFRQLTPDSNTYVMHFTLEASSLNPKKDSLAKIKKAIEAYLG